MAISLKSISGGAGVEIGQCVPFPDAMSPSSSPLYEAPSGAVFLKSGNVISGANATLFYPDAAKAFGNSVGMRPREGTGSTFASPSYVAHDGSKFIAPNVSELLMSADGSTWNASAIEFAADGGIACGDGKILLLTSSGIYVSLDGGATWRNTLSSAITVAAYNGSYWIAAGPGGALYKSADAETWSAKTSGFSTTDILTIAHGNGTWVIGGKSGKLATSTDGDTWTLRTSGFDSYQILSAIYAADTWIIGGQLGKIATSTDAVTWTSRTSTFGSDFVTSLAYGGNTIVACGTSGKCATSSDGTSWTSRSVGMGTQNLRALVYAGSQFVTLGDRGGIGVSSDGTTWTTDTTSNCGPIASIGFNGANDMWFAYGAYTGLFVESADRSTWTVVDTGVASLIKDIRYGASLWVMATSNGLYYSSDRRSWVQGSSLVFSCARYIGGKWVAWGSNGIYTSADGMSWSKATTDLTTQMVTFVVYGGDVYCAVCNYGYILTSTDASTWTTRRTNANDSYYFDSVAYIGNGTFVASNGSGRNLFVSSDSGVTWSEVSADAGSPSPSNMVALGSGLLLATTNSGKSVISSRNAGVSWDATEVRVGFTSVKKLEVDENDDRYCLAAAGLPLIAAGPADIGLSSAAAAGGIAQYVRIK